MSKEISGIVVSDPLMPGAGMVSWKEEKNATKGSSTTTSTLTLADPIVNCPSAVMGSKTMTRSVTPIETHCVTKIPVS